MKYLSFLVFVLLIQGCTTSTGGYFASYNDLKYQVAHDDIIVSDVIATLKKHYPPAKTTLSLFLEREDAFSFKFSNALMSAGYAVSINEGKLGYVPLAYKIDRVGTLIRITVNVEKLQFSRIYRESENALIPYSPISMRGL